MNSDDDIKRIELEQEREFREKELLLREREFRHKKINNPLVIALIATTVGIYGHLTIEKHNNNLSILAKSQFCYDIIVDLVEKPPEERKELAQRLKAHLTSESIDDCQGDIRELADIYSSDDNTLSIIEPPTATPEAECKKITSITQLGWRSGHKTNFCINIGYDGVHNPFGDYSQGGFCFTGDSKACISEIETMGR